MCIFCKIIEGDIPCYKVFEDEHTMAFLDVNPMTKGHMLVITKHHEGRFYDLKADENLHLFRVVHNLAKCAKDALNVHNVMLAAIGTDIAHVHIHIIPRYEGDGHGGALNFHHHIQVPEDEMKEILGKIKSCIE